MRTFPLLLATMFFCIAGFSAHSAARVSPSAANSLTSNPMAATICLIDKTVAADGLVFQSCVASAENDALLKRGFTTARIDHYTIKSKQPIWAHGVCKFIDNRSNNRDVLVPFGTEDEWKSFIQFAPELLKIAGCCTPRPIVAKDIPEPTTPCLGQWALREIVAAETLSVIGGQEKVAEEKMRLNSDDTLSNMNGDLAQFPLARDDENSILNLDNTKEFAARWSCLTDPTEDPAAKPPAPVTGAEQNPADPAPDAGLSKNSDVLFTHFYFNCVKENWVPVSMPELCVPYEGNRTYLCEHFGFPAGTKGEVVVQERTTCPGGATTQTLLQENCIPPDGAAAQ